MKSKLLSFLLILLLVCPVSWAGVDFDGTDDYINRTSTPITAYPVSMCAWVNSNSTSDQFIFSVAAGAAGLGDWFAILLEGTGQVAGLQVNAAPSGFEQTNTVATWSTNTWVHVCGVFSSSTSRTIYLNGGNAVTGTTNLTPGNIDRLAAGALNDILGPRVYFSGKITDVSVWNKALTDSEISILYTSKIKRMPQQISPSSLKIYWPLDEQPDGTSFDGDIAIDRSGNGNDGTGVDGATDTGLTAKAEEVLTYS